MAIGRRSLIKLAGVVPIMSAAPRFAWAADDKADYVLHRDRPYRIGSRAHRLHNAVQQSISGTAPTLQARATRCDRGAQRHGHTRTRALARANNTKRGRWCSRGRLAL